ncbi:MAG: polymer-forming cytoskeletal protein [Anaerolineales bacterium]
MNHKFRMISLILVAFLAILPLFPAAAASGVTIPGQFIFGQSFTLRDGQTMQGDLMIFGGSATIEKGATVNGNVVVFGGSLTINGNVNQDAVIFGGTATLGATAHILGNLSTLSSTLDRAEGALVDGQVNTANNHFGEGRSGTIPPTVMPFNPFNFWYKAFNPMLSVLTGVTNAFGQSIFLGLLAMLLMLFLAPRADRVAHAIISQPVAAGGLGLLTLVVVPVILVALGLLSILIITLVITVPLIIIISIALGMAVLFGWIAVGYEIGQRFTQAIHQEWSPVFSAGLGTFALTLVATCLTYVPGVNCIGWLAPFLISMAALGAVLMTRFGTQPVVAPSDPADVAPAKPAE